MSFSLSIVISSNIGKPSEKIFFASFSLMMADDCTLVLISTAPAINNLTASLSFTW